MQFCSVCVELNPRSECFVYLLICAIVLPVLCANESKTQRERRVFAQYCHALVDFINTNNTGGKNK